MTKKDKETSRFVWADRDDTSCDIDVNPKQTNIPNVNIDFKQEKDNKRVKRGNKS
jgi:hypothetical protein